VEYVCTANGKEVTFTIVEGEPNGEHVLNGKVAEGTEIVRVGDETVKAFKYGTEGIKVFNNQTIKANTTVKGYFRCEKCEELVQVWVYIPADYQP
jgi:hypothetical protein